MVQQPSDVHFATVSFSTDVTLHYAERGDRKGEAILFLHAYTDSWFAFSRVLALLSSSYHAFAPDERGHGTQISLNAATRWTTSAPMWMRSWTKWGSRRRPSWVTPQAA